MHRVSQNHIYAVYVRYFWQENPKNTVTYGVYIYGSGQPYNRQSRVMDVMGARCKHIATGAGERGGYTHAWR